MISYMEGATQILIYYYIQVEFLGRKFWVSLWNQGGGNLKNGNLSLTLDIGHDWPKKYAEKWVKENGGTIFCKEKRITTVETMEEL